MFPYTLRSHLTLIALLLVSMKRADSVKTNTERRLADSSGPGALRLPLESPYWEYILREFLFKTISPSPQANNMLYKELLEAPFYRGPFPVARTLNDGETTQVLSRGDVYQLAKGSWIICQEGCMDCGICTVQKTLTIPAVKWILRRIRRNVSLARSERHDLQLTVSPQADGSFHMKNLSPDSYVYVTSNNGALDSFTETLIREQKEYSLRYPFGTTKSPTRNTPGEVFFSVKDKGEGLDHEEAVTQRAAKSPETENEVFHTESQLKTITPTVIPETQTVPRREEDREILRGGENQQIINATAGKQKRGFENLNATAENATPLPPFHPSTVSTAHSIDDDCEKEKNTRLVLGRDQFGEKHLVHVVSAGDFDDGNTRASVHPGARFGYRQPAMPRPFQTKHEDSPLYRKIFRRVIDSLNSNKNAIEQFLFSPKLEAQLGHEKSSIVPAGEFHEEGRTALNNVGGNLTGTATPENVDKSEVTDETAGNDSRTAIDYQEEMIEYGESSTSRTPEVSNEEDEASESDYSTVQVTEDQTQGPNTNLHNLEGQNSDRSLYDELMKRRNNTVTLILKEVAKSVVNHPDTLQGFNPLSNSSLHSESVDSAGRTISDSITGSAEHSR